MLVIKVVQDWRLTRVVDTELHSWEMFVKPTELEETLRRHAMRLGEITGLGPRSNKAALLWNFIQTRRGRITFGQLSRLMDVGQVKDTAVSYMGYATKRPDRSEDQRAIGIWRVWPGMTSAGRRELVEVGDLLDDDGGVLGRVGVLGDGPQRLAGRRPGPEPCG